jgi:hypothetical protein
MGKPLGKRPLERPRRRWEDYIKMDIREIGCEHGDWLKIVFNNGCWNQWC